MTATLEVEVAPAKLRIKLNGILHLSIFGETLAFHSWEDDNGLFCIEYSTAFISIQTEYENRELWERILKELEKIQ